MELGAVHIAVEIVLFVLGILLATISWQGRERTRAVEDQLGQHDGRIRQLETRVGETAVEMRQVTQTLASVGELRAEIAARFMTRTDMAELMERINDTRDQVAGMREEMARHLGSQPPRRPTRRGKEG